MQMPAGMTEEEVLEIIKKVVTVQAPSYAFGPHGKDDMIQMGTLFALEALPRYDGVRRLECFLYIHVKRRLINFQRDKLRRNDPPCLKCHGGKPCQKNGGYCHRYNDWLIRNKAKANIIRPVELTDEHPHRDSDCEGQVERDELIRLVDLELPVGLRSDYLKMRDGAPIPQIRKQAVMDAVKEILGDLI